MAQTVPFTIYPEPLPPICPPKGFRTLPTSHPHEGGTYMSPAGLTVEVMDVLEDGKTFRRITLSRPHYWPGRDEVDLALRLFLRGDRPYRVAQQFGTGPLIITLEHCLEGGDGTLAESERDKALLFERIAEQNSRRERLFGLPRSVKRQAPEGWRRRPGPSGPIFDDRAGLQVVLSEESRDDGSRWAFLSVSRADRMPSEAEALAAARDFLGEVPDGLSVQHPTDPRAAERPILFVACRVG
jgi:hypothetical protein